MKIVGIVGPAESGKTNLIISLIQELKSRGRKCGVLKRADHPIELDVEEKDSYRLQAGGADEVAVLTPEKFFLIKKGHQKDSWLSFGLEYFASVDILFIEGGKREIGLKKVLVATKPEDINLLPDKEDLIALVCEKEFTSAFPVFRPHQARELADYLWNSVPPLEPLVYLQVDGTAIPLNPFVASMFQEIITAMLRPLKGIPESPHTICVTLKK
jgi:molybdopterin-guanine dinucleotide biosynthesis protein B